MHRWFKLNWIPILALLILVWFNEAIVFPKYQNFYIGYLAKLLCINVVLFTLLSNASYYSNRAKLERRFILFSFLSFIVLTNLLIGLGLLFKDPAGYLIDMVFWLSIGRLIFFFGFTRLGLKPAIIKKFEHTGLLFFYALGLVALQTLVWFLWKGPLGANKLIIFIMDVGASGILLLALINAIVEASIDEHFESAIAIAFFLAAQMAFTLMPYTFPSLIQAHLILAFGAGTFFAYLNRINSTLPALENANLKRQFNLYAKNLKKIIDKRTVQLTEINDKFIEELEYAKKIQQSLLPKTQTQIRDVTILSGYFPCERVSGDFYDVYRIDDDNLALYLLDVAGHGISAALMTMFSNNHLKSNEQHLMRFRGLKPDLNLQQFYQEFNQMHFPDEMHMVMFYATLNLNNRMLTYCSGGMNCIPIHIKPNGKFKFLDQSKGFPICKIDDSFVPEFVSARVALEKGDRIVFYTDGLIDEEKNNLFDQETLIQFLVDNRSRSIQDLYELLLEQVRANKDGLNDDVTFVIMEL